MGGLDFAQVSQMMANPQISAMINNLMANPQFMQQSESKGEQDYATRVAQRNTSRHCANSHFACQPNRNAIAIARTCVVIGRSQAIQTQLQGVPSSKCLRWRILRCNASTDLLISCLLWSDSFSADSQSFSCDSSALFLSVMASNPMMAGAQGGQPGSQGVNPIMQNPQLMSSMMQAMFATPPAAAAGTSGAPAPAAAPGAAAAPPAAAAAAAANPFAALFAAQAAAGGAPQGGAPGTAAQPGAQGPPVDWSQLFSAINLSSGGGGASGAAAAGGLQPAVLYREQLNQLNSMGFTDPQANINALIQTGGNVSDTKANCKANTVAANSALRRLRRLDVDF